MKMLKVDVSEEKNAVEMKGTTAELINDLANIVYGVTRGLLEKCPIEEVRNNILEMIKESVDGGIEKAKAEVEPAELTECLKELKAMREKLEAEREELEKDLPEELIELAKRTAKDLFEVMKKNKEKENGDKE